MEMVDLQIVCSVLHLSSSVLLIVCSVLHLFSSVLLIV